MHLYQPNNEAILNDRVLNAFLNGNHVRDAEWEDMMSKDYSGFLTPQSMRDYGYINFATFLCVVGRIDGLKKIEQRSPERLREMIKWDPRTVSQYNPFFVAAANGHTDILKFLVAKLTPTGFVAFFIRLLIAPITFTRWLLGYPSTDPVQQMIAADDFHVIWLALENSHANTVQFLLTKAPDEFQARIADKFPLMVGSDHSQTVELPTEKAQDQFQESIGEEDSSKKQKTNSRRDYNGFSSAGVNTSLAMNGQGVMPKAKLDIDAENAPGQLEVLNSEEDCGYRVVDVSPEETAELAARLKQLELSSHDFAFGRAGTTTFWGGKKQSIIPNETLDIDEAGTSSRCIF